MNWHDINSPGFLISRSEKESRTKQVEELAQKEPKENPTPEIKILSSQWTPGPKGFLFNEECHLDLKIQFLKQPAGKRITGFLFVKWNDQAEDVHSQIDSIINDDGTCRLTFKKLFMGNDYYDAKEKNPSLVCHYFCKIKHVSSKDEYLGSELEMPASLKIAVDFIEIADVHFHHNCALPCLHEKGDLIAAYLSAYAYVKDNGDRELVVEGHADRSGDKEYNLRISKRRAEAIKGLIDNDAALWKGVVDADGADQKIETEDYQQTMKSLAVKYGWSCDSGAVDNAYGPKTETAVKNFQTATFAVWRKIDFNQIYEMQGTNHVSTHATTAIIAPYFSPAKVIYTAGAANPTPSALYIGLWKSAATPQESWAAIYAKLPAETPGRTEITDANYAGADPALVAKRNTARAGIIGKAQAWVNRIDTARSAAMIKWQADNHIPHNCIVGIRKFHPKYSSTGDTVTHQWNLGGAGTPVWLRVSAFSGNYTNIDPDQIWVNGGEWGGLSVGNGVFLVPDYIAHAIVKVVCHEAGHASKTFFKRDDFGPSLDHSHSNAGIMYWNTSGGNNFTDREKKILRGVVP